MSTSPSGLAALYRPALGLLTDLYQLTMAAGYHAAGLGNHEAVFHLYFRKAPFGGSVAVTAGLETALEFLEGLRFAPEDLDFLGTLTGNDGKPLFTDDFLAMLGGLSFQADVDGIPEGRVALPHEPILRLQGPLIQLQLVETALLAILNFQTLIATKAARVKLAAEGRTVLEFGLRRAQGIDGGLSASRAAWVGGVDATSNVLAGRLFGIPVRGTHAHSWVLSFDREVEAFETYAAALPNNCTFLVDTYDTVTGVQRAAAVGQSLRARGFEMAGVRLDSGDLADLSRKARAILDAAGEPQAKVVASNDLDEQRISALMAEGAPIDVFGVGTRLVTGGNQSALGGVYKLSAIRAPGEDWRYRVKKSEDPVKISLPGRLGVRRVMNGGQLQGDLIYDVGRPLSEAPAVDRLGRPAPLPAGEGEALLVPLLRGGARVAPAEGLGAARARAAADLAALPAAMRRLEQPEAVPQGLDRGLYDETQRLLAIGGGAS